MRIIGGEWGGRRLNPLKGRDVRPTSDRVREAWMSAMGGRFDGLVALDLFAGSGALGLELLSRGADHVTSVERGRQALTVLRSNAALVGAGDALRIVGHDVFRFLESEEPTVDLAVADPPYATDDAARLLASFAERPFAKELWLEHPFRHSLDLPPSARTRRYGDTAITTLIAPP